MRQIVLISDYGFGSIYTGLVKSQIYKITRNNNYLDFYHNIDRENIINGAFLIENTYNSFDKDSVLCCNVDPDIYTDRDILIARKSNQFFVAPDNGILSSIMDEYTEVYKADMSEYIVEDKNMEISYVAAKIAIDDMSVLGEKIPLDLIKQFDYSAIESRENIVGNICHIDNFGNLISNIDNHHYENLYEIEIEDEIVIEFNESYNQSAENILFAYKGSLGKIEIAIKNKNSAKSLNLKVSDRIIAKKKG
ncbi:MAG: S-adenosyl-l-methionine hydroxide adenosyltransferase family protein [Chlorobiota bacterium]